MNHSISRTFGPTVRWAKSRNVSATTASGWVKEAIHDGCVRKLNQIGCDVVTDRHRGRVEKRCVIRQDGTGDHC